MTPRGTTLFELLAALAVAVTLLGLAVPAWQDARTRAWRADAREALLHVRALQERHYFAEGRYAGTLASLPFAVDARSAAGHYRLTLEAIDEGEGFIVRAAPASDGPQRGDAGCRELWMDDRGRRGASGTPDAAQRCWR